jgi:hypothetical protein
MPASITSLSAAPNPAECANIAAALRLANVLRDWAKENWMIYPVRDAAN